MNLSVHEPITPPTPTDFPSRDRSRAVLGAGPSPSPAPHCRLTVRNALTIDVEDWIQSVLDVDRPLTARFVRNTHRVLEFLADRDVKATFFILGLAAENAPELVREIHRAGHEVQSHGWGHRLLHTLARKEIRNDLLHSKKLLEDITGEPIIGYRAPAFSITRRNLWVLDVIAECGYRYDSSIVPAATRRYGIDGVPWWPFRLATPSGAELIEVPVATFRFFRRRPIGGGGYFRLYPASMIVRSFRALNRAGIPATAYVHPYEFAPNELSELATDAGNKCFIPLRLRLTQGLGRGGVPRKLDRLLSEFSFGPVGEVIRTTPQTMIRL